MPMDSPFPNTRYFFSLAALYNWRYKKVGNLKHVETTREFQLANPGLAYDYQLIDVGDYNGIGESAPSPYFYQVWCFCFLGSSIRVIYLFGEVGAGS